MKSKFVIIGLLAASSFLPAQALTQKEIKRCNAMAASFSAKKVEITSAKEKLDAKVEKTELAGERWEAAEEMKLISPGSAKEAETAKSEWETLKKEVLREQMALQSQVSMLNTDVASFNASCAKD